MLLWAAYFAAFVHYITPYTVMGSRGKLRGTVDTAIGLTMGAAAPLIGLWFAKRMTRRAKKSVKYNLGAVLFLIVTATMLIIGVVLVLMDYRHIMDAMG